MDTNYNHEGTKELMGTVVVVVLFVFNVVLVVVVLYLLAVFGNNNVVPACGLIKAEPEVE